MSIIAILTTLFGIAMSCGYFAQTYKIIKTKTTKGVSLATYLFFGLGITMWLIYGITVGDLPIIISNIVYLVGALAVIGVYFIYKNK